MKPPPISLSFLPATTTTSTQLLLLTSIFSWRRSSSYSDDQRPSTSSSRRSFGACFGSTTTREGRKPSALQSSFLPSFLPSPDLYSPSSFALTRGLTSASPLLHPLRLPSSSEPHLVFLPPASSTSPSSATSLPVHSTSNAISLHPHLSLLCRPPTAAPLSFVPTSFDLPTETTNLPSR